MSVLVKFGHTLSSLVVSSLVFSCLVMVAGSSTAFAQDTAGKDTAEKGAAELAAIEGVWLTKQGRSHLKVTPCGDSLCNEIIWLKQPLDRAGKPQTDKLNKNGKLRGRPIIGISIMLKMRRVQDNMWKGWLYDPEKGKAFQGHARLITANKLEVKGCSSILPICKTHIWKKVSGLENNKSAEK
jgi:uncharacterized protein (DUF2147 family)